MRLIFVVFFYILIFETSNLKGAEPDSIVLADTFSIGNLGKFCFPIKNKVISHFGMRGSIMHTGTDIKLQKGDTVYAAFSGIVSKAEKYYGYGKLVIIAHPDNFETYYAHLNDFLVHLGDTIKAGQPLGLGGRTGRATTTHLHFELRKNRKAYNPEAFFDFNNQIVITNSYAVKVDSTQKKNQEIDKNVVILAQTDEFHVIKKGDTLYSLAKRYNTSVAKLKEINNLSEKSKLSIGKKLKIK